MKVIATGIGTMEDFEGVEKLEANLRGKAAMEDIESVQKLEVNLTG